MDSNGPIRSLHRRAPWPSAFRAFRAFSRFPHLRVQFHFTSGSFYPNWAWNYMVIELFFTPIAPPQGQDSPAGNKGSLWFVLSTAVAAATVLAAGVRLTQSTLLAQHLLQGMLDGPLDHAFLSWKLSMKIDPETTAKLAKYRLNMDNYASL